MNDSTIRGSRVIATVVLFSVAMGFLEAAVAFYLRLLYYPEGFIFPVKPIPGTVIPAEIMRETATIIMLAAIGILSGKNHLQRFAFFLLAFGIWDITYYAGLKVLLGWPESLMTWDLLFLIPVPWVSPVISPVICSVTMILFFTIVYFNQAKGFFRIRIYEWSLTVAGALLILFSFIRDYGLLTITHLKNGGGMTAVRTATEAYVPSSFDWISFTAGELLIISALALMMVPPKERTVKG